MSIKSNAKKIGAFVGLAAFAALSQNPSAAVAASDACDESYAGAITTGNGACEVTFLSTPAETFQVPAGVSALQALLVAGGGAGSTGYAGGGGEVKVVDLETAGDVTIHVAAQPAPVNDGEDSFVTQGSTTFTAKGGLGNGVSGNGNPGSSSGFNTGAGGAGGAGGRDTGDNNVGDVGVNPTNMPEFNGGLGLVVKDIAGATLFSDDTDCFGGGGANNGQSSFGDDIQFGWNGVAVCGAGSTVIDPANDTVTIVEATANSGGGAGAHPYDSVGRAGSSGRVVLRYTLAEVTTTAVDGEPKTTLANTGGTLDVVPFIAGLAIVAAGAVALRRRNN